MNADYVELTRAFHVTRCAFCGQGEEKSVRSRQRFTAGVQSTDFPDALVRFSTGISRKNN